MRKLALLTFVTLDGVMQAPSVPEEDTSGGFEHGGWARSCWDEVMEQVMHEAMAKPYDLLLGRATYEMFATGFSDAPADNPVADKLNAAKKYVVTSKLTKLPWQNSVVLTGDITEQVKQLKTQDGPLLQVHGSWQLVQTLIAHGLVDEFRIWTFPVVVGSGKRLFEGNPMPQALTLVKSDTTKNGATMSIYRSN